MIPVALDPAKLPLAVAGRGPAALRRARLLAAAGAAPVALFSDRPGSLQPDETSSGTALEGVAARPGLPDEVSLAQLRLLWIAGLPEPDAAALVASARAARVLVNVEDRPEWCDFHSVAEVRRGHLLLTVSTGGRSPGLASRIRAHLEAAFGPEWAERTASLGTARDAWRADGVALPELARRSDAAINRAGWLP